MFVADVASGSLAPCKTCMTVRTLVLRLLSVVIRSGKVFGKDMAFERRRVCKYTIAVLASIHV